MTPTTAPPFLTLLPVAHPASAAPPAPLGALVAADVEPRPAPPSDDVLERAVRRYGWAM